MPPLSDNSEEWIEMVLTCEGDYYDPDLPQKLVLFNNKLQQILHAEKERLVIKKVEPWNSVKVTLNIPREAAVRLKVLAEEGSEALRCLGVLAVQIEGDRAISLTFASKNNEQTKVLLSAGSSEEQYQPNGVTSIFSTRLQRTGGSSLGSKPQSLDVATTNGSGSSTAASLPAHCHRPSPKRALHATRTACLESPSTAVSSLACAKPAACAQSDGTIPKRRRQRRRPEEKPMEQGLRKHESAPARGPASNVTAIGLQPRSSLRSGVREPTVCLISASVDGTFVHTKPDGSQAIRVAANCGLASLQPSLALASSVQSAYLNESLPMFVNGTASAASESIKAINNIITSLTANVSRSVGVMHQPKDYPSGSASFGLPPTSSRVTPPTDGAAMALDENVGKSYLSNSFHQRAATLHSGTLFHAVEEYQFATNGKHLYHPAGEDRLVMSHAVISTALPCKSDHNGALVENVSSAAGAAVATGIVGASFKTVQAVAAASQYRCNGSRMPGGSQLALQRMRPQQQEFIFAPCVGESENVGASGPQRGCTPGNSPLPLDLKDNISASTNFVQTFPSVQRAHLGDSLQRGNANMSTQSQQSSHSESCLPRHRGGSVADGAGIGSFSQAGLRQSEADVKISQTPLATDCAEETLSRNARRYCHSRGSLALGGNERSLLKAPCMRCCDSPTVVEHLEGTVMSMTGDDENVSSLIASHTVVEERDDVCIVNIDVPEDLSGQSGAIQCSVPCDEAATASAMELHSHDSPMNSPVAPAALSKTESASETETESGSAVSVDSGVASSSPKSDPGEMGAGSTADVPEAHSTSVESTCTLQDRLPSDIPEEVAVVVNCTIFEPILQPAPLHKEAIRFSNHSPAAARYQDGYQDGDPLDGHSVQEGAAKAKLFVADASELPIVCSASVAGSCGSSCSHGNDCRTETNCHSSDSKPATSSHRTGSKAASREALSSSCRVSLTTGEPASLAATAAGHMARVTVVGDLHGNADVAFPLRHLLNNSGIHGMVMVAGDTVRSEEQSISLSMRLNSEPNGKHGCGRRGHGGLCENGKLASPASPPFHESHVVRSTRSHRASDLQALPTVYRDRRRPSVGKR